MSNNTWPGGRRRAMSQGDHEAWNAGNYPGTRQLCSECDEPTGRCEEDAIYTDAHEESYGEIGPLCEECWEGIQRGGE